MELNVLLLFDAKWRLEKLLFVVVTNKNVAMALLRNDNVKKMIRIKWNLTHASLQQLRSTYWMRASLGIPQLFKNFRQPLNPRATFLHLHQYTNALKSGRQRRQDDSWLEDVVFAISLISAWYNPTRRWSLFILAFPNGFGRPRLAFRQISTPFLTIPLFFS